MNDDLDKLTYKHDWTLEEKADVARLLAKATNAAGKKSYLKGYNSGWVKATRLIDSKSMEYWATQLEVASQALRNALKDKAQLKPPKVSREGVDR